MDIKIFFVTNQFATFPLGIKKQLFSYWYYRKVQQRQKLAKETKPWHADPEAEIFIDFGAFSTFTQKAKINVADYCKFIREIKPTIYAALDVIGDPEASAKNTEVMEKEFNLKPIPCYHLCEDYKYLRAMIKDHDYIALGGMVGAGSVKLVPWLDNTWSIIMKEKPKLKVHGFGMTILDLIEKYPWCSCDSSTIIARIQRFGDMDIIDDRNMVVKQHVTSFMSDHFQKTGDQRIWQDKEYKRAVALAEQAKIFLKRVALLKNKPQAEESKNYGNIMHLPGFEI